MACNPNLTPSSGLKVGDTVSIEDTVTNDSGTATDADTYTVTVKEPDGTTHTLVYDNSDSFLTITKTGTGVYVTSFDADATGFYTWKAEVVVGSDTDVADGYVTVCADQTA